MLELFDEGVYVYVDYHFGKNYGRSSSIGLLRIGFIQKVEEVLCPRSCKEPILYKITPKGQRWMAEYSKLFKLGQQRKMVKRYWERSYAEKVYNGPKISMEKILADRYND